MASCVAWTAALLAATLLGCVHGHGRVTTPISKNELAFRLKESFPQGGSFRYEPQSSANGNLFGSISNAPGSSCGASEALYEEGPVVWQQWYDASRGLAMPTLTPGADLEVSAKITADHGGQAWMMVACGNSINENVNWRYLERAPGDRTHHFMPSNPAVYAWAVGESKSSNGVLRASFRVPEDLACADGHAVGRWLWKTANSCIDSNNVGRKTETFNLGEYKSVAPSGLGVCGGPPEIFISCFDFQVPSSGLPSTPAPTPTTSFLAPTLAPTAPPSFATTASPTSPMSSTTATTTGSSSGLVCTAVEGAVQVGATDERCQTVCGLVGFGEWPCGSGYPCLCTDQAATQTSTTSAESTTLSTTAVVSTTSASTGGTSSTQVAGACVATPGLNRGVADSDCARCPTGYQHWPCNEASLCTGDCSA